MTSAPSLIVLVLKPLPSERFYKSTNQNEGTKKAEKKNEKVAYQEQHTLPNRKL